MVAPVSTINTARPGARLNAPPSRPPGSASCQMSCGAASAHAVQRAGAAALAQSPIVPAPVDQAPGTVAQVGGWPSTEPGAPSHRSKPPTRRGPRSMPGPSPRLLVSRGTWVKQITPLWRPDKAAMEIRWSRSGRRCRPSPTPMQSPMDSIPAPSRLHRRRFPWRNRRAELHGLSTRPPSPLRLGRV